MQLRCRFADRFAVKFTAVALILVSPDLLRAVGAPAALVVTESRATGKATMVKPAPGQAIAVVPAPGKARPQPIDFFTAHGHHFGITNAQKQLVRKRASTDTLNQTHTTFEQVHQGVPVFGAEIIVHTDANNNVRVVNGTGIPAIKVNPVPSINANDADDIALQHVRLQVRRGVQLAVADRTLYVFRTNLARGIPGANHLAYEVEVTDGVSVREFVYVDAHAGDVLDQITGIHGIDRRIYDGGFGGSFLKWSEGNTYPFVGANAAGINDLINFAEDSYNFYASISNGTFLSWDALDSTMHSVLNDPQINCPNANWNGVSTNYCNGTSNDDIVAHEWSHAYTETTHNLIYQWQSGALNEAYSDIFGETIDLLNGAGTDSPVTARSAGGCSQFGVGSPSVDNSYRWLMGEDSTAFGGAIRDMWNPTCYGDPGKVSDTQYHCATTDAGGVHSNSGVPNHMYALLVDGGTYNGQTITAIGLTKAAHLYWRAQTVYQTPATGFSEHADAIEQSCQDLIGVNLVALTTSGTGWGNLSGEIFTNADCQEVADAIAAVELRTFPTQCNFTTVLAPNPPPLCNGLGSTQTVQFYDFESGPQGWTAGTRDIANIATFDTPDWAVVGSLPQTRPGQAAFVADLIIGNCTTDDESGVLHFTSPIINIPASAYGPRVAFEHYVATEATWDGGNVKVSVNGGAYQLVPASAFNFNAYNTTLSTVGAGNTNPMAGEEAFSGVDGGTISGSWGQSQLTLAGIAGPGDNIRLRFEMGLDGCNGAIGWYVDDVRVFYCTGELPGANCGNSILDLLETCDDGNTSPGDGCSDICLVEPGYQCTDPDDPTPGVNILPDGSFAGGTPNAIWSETYTNFGSPLCTAACGGGAATHGIWFAWFGGISTFEAGSVQQVVTIPAGSTLLEFDLAVGICDSDSDYVRVTIDGIELLKTTPCAVIPYLRWQFDISSFADNNPHTLRIDSEIFAINAGQSNFFVDNVTITGPPVAGDPSVCTPVSAPPTLTSAVSRKTHKTAGNHDIAMGIAPAVGDVECRDSGTTHVALTFDRDILPADGTYNNGDEIVVTSTPGATITASNFQATGNVLEFDLTGAANRSCIEVVVTGIADDDNGSPGAVMTPVTLKQRVVAGDVGTSGTTTSADINQAKTLTGPVTGANYRADLNADGTVNATDVNQARAATRNVTTVCP